MLNKEFLVILNWFDLAFFGVQNFNFVFKVWQKQLEVVDREMVALSQSIFIGRGSPFYSRWHMGQGKNLGKGINIFIFELKMRGKKRFYSQKEIVNFSVMKMLMSIRLNWSQSYKRNCVLNTGGPRYSRTCYPRFWLSAGF